MRISDWSSDVCSSDLGRITVFQDLPVRVRCHAGDGAELPGTDVQCVERWKLERTQIWIGFYRRVSRVTRKDSLTTAEFRVDANIGVAIETAHRLFERRRIESEDRRSTRLNSRNKCAHRLPSSARKKK